MNPRGRGGSRFKRHALTGLPLGRAKLVGEPVRPPPRDKETRMGIFDRAKDFATTKPGSSNEGTVVASGGQPADPDVTGTPVGTGVTDESGEGGIGAARDRSAGAEG